MSWTIERRTAVVTGAARGIGAASARSLHERGMNVVLAGLEPERLEANARELGPRAFAVTCDVTDPEQLETAVEAALERFGAIDAVVANAGVNAVGTLETSDPSVWEQVIEVNLLGVVRTVRAALPHVIAQQGYILTVSSLAGTMPLVLGANYTAAKHGVNGFAQALRAEVAHEGVAVGCAYFGAIDTDLLRSSSADPATAELLSGLPRLVSRTTPVARAGEVIARGVAGRARRVYAPSWILPMLLAPGLFIPLSERFSAHANAEAVRTANGRARAGQAGVTTFVDQVAGGAR